MCGADLAGSDGMGLPRSQAAHHHGATLMGNDRIVTGGGGGMTFALIADLNWLAVLVAALAYVLLGGLRFLPRAFGDAWTTAMGWVPTEDDEPEVELHIGPLRRDRARARGQGRLT